MKKTFSFVILITFIFQLVISSSSVLIAQPKNIRFDHFSMKDGLPDDGLWFVMQDTYGFIWIGTRNGLSKFDGYTFTNYLDGSNNITKSVLCLMEDEDNDIWVGTRLGLAIYIRNKDRFNFFYHDTNNQKSLSHNWVRDIFQDSKGNVWLGTKGGGLNFVDKELIRKNKTDLKFKKIVYNDKIEGMDYVFDIHEDSNGSLWICTLNGLLNIENDQLELYQVVESKVRNKKNHFICIDQDNQNDLWIGNIWHGLVKFNIKNKDFNFYNYNNKFDKYYSLNSITGIFIDSKKNIWIGTRSGIDCGIFIFNRQANEFVRYANYPYDPTSISKDDGLVRSIQEDNVGNIWIVQNEGQLNVVNSRKNFFRYYRKYTSNPDQLLFSKITRMLEATDGRIWFAGDNGLFLFDEQKDSLIKTYPTIDHTKANLNNECWGLIEDNSGYIWTVARKDEIIIRYDPKSNLIKYYDEEIKTVTTHFYCLTRDNNGMMWIGTYQGGLSRWNPNTNEIQNLNLDPDNKSIINDVNKILRVCKDKSNYVWFSNNDGNIGKVNIYTNQITILSTPDNTGYFCDLFVDTSNRLWTGSHYGGVIVIDKNDNLKQFTVNDGLPTNNYVAGFSQDNNDNIYCCSSDYLIKFDKYLNLKVCYKIAEDDEKLHTTYYVEKTNEVFVISDKGFYRFDPDSLKPNLLPPSIYLTDIKILDKSLTVGDDSPLKKNINLAESITLEYWQNDISFEYSALHFINPKANKYKYYLENYDNGWKDVGFKREATYTNLSHGKYTFKVLASNSDGIWTKEPAALSITILPPFWLTWWAYTLYGILIILAFTITWIMQMRRIKIKHELSMKEFETAKLKEVDQMKSNFFANISHEFRTPLTLIKGPVEGLLHEEKSKERKEVFKVILRNTKKLLNLINELLDLSKLEAGKLRLCVGKYDIVSFTKGIIMSFNSLADSKEIDIKINSQENYIELYYDKEKMQKIISNIVSNALKFTPERGKIDVSIHKNEHDNNLEIKIEDSGIGVPENELPKLFDRFYQVIRNGSHQITGTGIGLALTKELVQMHKGTINVKSEVNKGTIFTLTFPMGKKHLKDDEIIINDNDDFDYNSIDVINIQEEETNKDRAKILIVEDNKDVLNYINDILKKEYTPILTTNGNEGLNKAKDMIPDLIISDIMMPFMNGNEMTRILKMDEKTSHIPIILLTAKADEGDKIKGLETGADDYIIKPFDPVELVVRIKNLINQRKNLRRKYLIEAEIHPAEVAVSSIDKKFIDKTIEYLEQNLTQESLSVEELASYMNMSRTQLYRKFCGLLGEKPNEFIRKYRLRRAAELLEQRFGNVAQVAYEVGFNDPAYFSKCFKKLYNVNPYKFITNNKINNEIENNK